MAIAFTNRRRGLSAKSFLVVLILLGLLGWASHYLFRQGMAYYEYRAAREALIKYRLTEARKHLDKAMAIWPNDVPCLLMAVRIARMAADDEEAEARFMQVLEIGGTNDTTDLEYAMLRAHHGDLDKSESYLRSFAMEGHPETLLIFDALAAGYLRMYRNSEAQGIIDAWLKQEPDCPQALYYRGRIFQRLHKYQYAADDYAKVVEADPERDDVRLWLASSLLEVNAPEKALEHLEILIRKRPDEPEVIVALANCYNNLGRLEEGIRLVDDLLKKDPHYGPALTGRGQMALQMRKPEEALPYLEKAVKETPIDMRANNELYQCLKQLGRDAEAEEHHKHMEATRKRVERLIEITNGQLAKNPNDPALPTELGKLMIMLYQPDLGERWLLTALEKDPGYDPAHQALADYYEKTGRLDQARAERAKIRSAPSKETPKEDAGQSTNKS